MRRWLALGRLPVVRLGEVVQFVECHACASTFDTDVLDGDEEAAVEDVVTRVLRRAAGIVLATDPLSPEERREAVIVLQRYTNVPYSSIDLRHDLERPERDHLADELADLAPSLNGRGQRAVINAGLLLSNRRGCLDTARLEALERVAGVLSIPSEQLRVATRHLDGQLLVSG